MIKFPTKRSLSSFVNQNSITKSLSFKLSPFISSLPFNQAPNSSSNSISPNQAQNFLSKVIQRPQENLRNVNKKNYLSSFLFQKSNKYGLNYYANAGFCSTKPESQQKQQEKWHVALLNMAFSQKQQKVFELLKSKGVNIELEDIVLKYKSNGKYSGDAYIECHSEEDMKKILALDNNTIESRVIKAIPAHEEQFEKAKISGQPLKMEVLTQDNETKSHRWSHLLSQKVGVLKLKNLPAGVQKEDIMLFFEGFKVVEDGIHISKEGTSCYVVFESKLEAQTAKMTAEAKEVLKHISFNGSNVLKLEAFLKQLDIQSGEKKKKKRKRVPEEKKIRILFMKNVPLSVSEETILGFFEGFELGKSDVLLKKNRAGEFSGRVQVVFQSKEEAHRAFREKNLSNIDDQYIELSDYWG